MGEVILECKHLNKKIGKKTILKDVSLTVNAGDIVAFIGPNGAGKTTTIKLILGLQRITSGTVIINGHDLEKDFVKAIERVGSIVENPDQYMYISGYQNLKLVANLYDNITEEKLEEVIDIVGMRARIHDKVKKYSLGMRQRLGIAIALLNNPNLLIFDEPTNGLDPEGIKDLRELFHTLASKYNIGILISSHNLLELESFCNKICIIKNGKVIENSVVNKNQNIKSSYLIEVNDLKKALKVLKNQAVIFENYLKFEGSKEEIAKVVKQLIRENIDVYLVKKEELSLEKIFFDKTGGNTID